jgi:hypothetical protein
MIKTVNISLTISWDLRGTLESFESSLYLPKIEEPGGLIRSRFVLPLMSELPRIATVDLSVNCGEYVEP